MYRSLERSLPGQTGQMAGQTHLQFVKQVLVRGVHVVTDKLYDQFGHVDLLADGVHDRGVLLAGLH